MCFEMFLTVHGKPCHEVVDAKNLTIKAKELKLLNLTRL